MNLKPLTLNEDRNNEAYATSECQQLLAMYEDFYPKIGFNLPWIGYFVEHDGKIVGSCSFVGKPKDRTVEIAYWTFKEFEGQGFASFACKELTRMARQVEPRLKITAKTAPEHNASTKILENNHFVFACIVKDDDIGDAWLWENKAPEVF